VSRVALGLGCDRGTSLRTLEGAVQRALAAVGLCLAAVEVLATIDRKRDEEAILSLAQGRGWPLRFFSAQDLSRVDAPSPSETVRKYMGTPAVSEAAAVLAAGSYRVELLLEKYKYRGDDGKHATVSVASIAAGE